MSDEDKSPRGQSAGEAEKQDVGPREDEPEVLEFEFNEDGPSYAEASEGEGGVLEKTLKKLRADLKACQAEKAEYLTGWQKERADFANYRKEEHDRRADFAKVVRESVLSRFLTVLDGFGMAFANKDAWEKVDGNWRRGVEHIYTQMRAVFEEYGVEEIGQVGEGFDPNFHQSVGTTLTDQKENDHRVSEVVQKGYKLGERILRPARVNIYEYEG